MSLRFGAMAALLVMTSNAAYAESAPSHEVCSELLAATTARPSSHHPVAPEDLLRLRDIISPPGDGPETSFEFSPNGDALALKLQRASPLANAYCVALVVVPLDARKSSRLIDLSDEFVPLNTQSDIFSAFQVGTPKAFAPKWSPDGRWIAHLRRDHGITQAWVTRTDGSRSLNVSRSNVDVESLAWSADGQRLIWEARTGLPAAVSAIDVEGLSGYHYDERFRPTRSSRPLPSVPLLVFASNLDGAITRRATSAEAELLSGSAPEAKPADLSVSGVRAWLRPREPRHYPVVADIVVKLASGITIRCAFQACDGGVIGVWWSENPATVFYLRREGWGRSDIALYRWSPDGQQPTRLLSTADLIAGCSKANDQTLVCAREASAAPRSLVSIDLRTGSMTTLFDPNPEWRWLSLGPLTRLTWRNDIGLQAFGDLVLPPEHRPGQKHPLIIVQYHSRGFLRGGVGDEYPIQAFAARGYAVLSVESPPSVGAGQNLEEAERVNHGSNANLKSQLSSIEQGIRAASKLGVVDEARIGITGFSDGSSIALYGLMNSNLFAAAAISHCCFADGTTLPLIGPRLAAQRRTRGAQSVTADPDEFDDEKSLAHHAATMNTPLLIQSSDREYLSNLRDYMALTEHHQPADLYVFPDEYHVKWQPAHRKAIYERSLQWFDFWLLCREDRDPSMIEQYARWKALRVQSDRPTCNAS